MTEQRQWTFPLPEQKVDFVFMAVDVIKHTDMLKEARDESNTAFRSVDVALSDLPDHISECIEWYHPGLRWDWAGDGGIYAFPVTYDRRDTLNVYEYVIRCAETIVNRLDEFNVRHQRTTRPVKLRIAFDAGDAVYRKDQAFCRGLALNIAAKLKVADDENSIAITSNLYREFRAIPSLKNCFVPITAGESPDARNLCTFTATSPNGVSR